LANAGSPAQPGKPQPVGQLIGLWRRAAARV